MPLPKQYGKDLPDVYAVFMFDTYYPGQGWADFEDAFTTLEAARRYIVQRGDPNTKTWRYDHWQIVNLTTLSKIEEGSYED